MADDLTAERRESLVQRPREEVRVHRVRFAAAYLALAVVAGAAVGAAVLAADDSRYPQEAAWSAWKPATTEPDAAREIAEYVSGLYQSDAGGRLVAVVASAPTFEDVPIRAVVIRSAVDGGVRETIETSNSLMFVLCGTGEACALDGDPTLERYQLLRREALELALYTFKYVRGAESVLVLMPPTVAEGTEEQVATTLFFQKKHFKTQLTRPLQATLTLTNPVAQGLLTPTDALTVERLTNPRVFRYELARVPDGSLFMLLAPQRLVTP